MYRVDSLLGGSHEVFMFEYAFLDSTSISTRWHYVPQSKLYHMEEYL